MLQNGNIYMCSKKEDVVILEERQKAKQKQIVTQGGDENAFFFCNQGNAKERFTKATKV